MPKPVKQLLYSLVLLFFVSLTTAFIYYVVKEFSKESININFTVANRIQTPTNQINYVIDGDTIKLGNGDKIRYIGINTPETNECYGEEATNENRRLIENSKLVVVKDKSETDKYGRLLRYVYINNCSEFVDTKYCELDNTLFVNKYLIQAGYAILMQIPPDTKYYEEFKTLESMAKAQKLGLWEECK